MSEPTESRPVLRIISGRPGPAELAAVTVALTALTAASARAPEPPAASGWADLSRRLGQPLPPGPGAWRGSGWS